MAHETSAIIGFAVDGAGGTLTSISGSVNSITFTGAMEFIDNSSVLATGHELIAGLDTPRMMTVNGFLNSTTRTIFMPLAANATSITKTIELKTATGKYYRGEAWPENVTITANPGMINTFSCMFKAAVSLTYTSVTGVA